MIFHYKYFLRLQIFKLHVVWSPFILHQLRKSITKLERISMKTLTCSINSSWRIVWESGPVSLSLFFFFHVLFFMLTELFLSYLSFYSFFLLLLTVLHFLLLLFIFSKLISLVFPSFCHSHYLNIFHSCFKSPPFPHFSHFHLVPFLLLIIIKILLFIVSFAFFNFFSFSDY